MGKQRHRSSDGPEGENRQSQAKEQQLRAALQQLQAEVTERKKAEEVYS
jgi:hypothetical protein